MAEQGIFNTSQLGIIGSCLFFAYAFGKLSNGIIADRVNLKRFLISGLLLSACINIALGFTSSFYIFALLWGFNGWSQSFGAPASVVSLSRWYSDSERGTFYGFWSSSHNIGEAITFILIAVVVSQLGWSWGFQVAGALGLFMCLLLSRFMFQNPECYGFYIRAETAQKKQSPGLSKAQLAVFKNPAIWTLALAAAFFYVARYAVNSWGIFFLETGKGYSTLEASTIISSNAIAGIVGTLISGLLSDRLCGGKRHKPALAFGLIYCLALAAFLYGPSHYLYDTSCMVVFGFSLGVLLVYLGGLMAVDLCSSQASGTALGIVGVASYLGAGFQDIISGKMIEANKTVIAGVSHYNFEAVSLAWVSAAVISMLLAACTWKSKAYNQDSK